MVSPCSALPDAGTWESIAPVSATSLTDTSGKNFSEVIVLDPFDVGTVWLGSGYSGLYKSTDCGSTWNNVARGMNGATATNGSIVSLAIDPVHRGTMYMVTICGTGGAWKSTNGGVDWEQTMPAGSEVASAVQYDAMNAISIDPTHPLHLVVTPHANCGPPSYASACEPVSYDGGETWQIVSLPFLKGWEEGAGAWIVDTNSWLYAGNSGLWLTTDQGATWSDVGPQGTGFQSGPQDLFQRSTDGTYYLTSLQGLLSSPDGRTWTPVAGCKGRFVPLAMGGGRLFSADQWSNTFCQASEPNPTCSPFTALPTIANVSGTAFLAYDSTHHVLYSSHLAGGLWRIVTQ
jgi:photosystem II stability/assembly factor-like uncharacterized protein